MRVSVLITPMILSFSVLAASKGVLVSATAGFYQDKIVTTREAEIANMIELGLNPKMKDNKSAQDKVSELLLQKIVYLETDSFSLQEPMLEFNSKKAPLLEQLKKDKNWLSLEVDTKEFETSLKEKIFAREFIKFKSDSFQSVVSEEQVKAYFQQHKEKFSGLDLNPFRENIKTFLIQQGRDEKLREWFLSLKKKYKVKNLLQSEKAVL